MEENTNTKLCTRCKTVKPVTEFPKINKTKAALKTYCKDCERARLQIYYEKNKDKLKVQHKEYSSKNKENIYEQKKTWYQKNKERMNQWSQEYHKEWFKKHPGKIKEYNTKAKIKKLEMNLNKLAVEEAKKMRE